jgi:hypothetical protein
LKAGVEAVLLGQKGDLFVRARAADHPRGTLEPGDLADQASDRAGRAGDEDHVIATVVARYHQEYEEAADRHLLTGAQARVLALLSREPMPMRRIAEQLRCEPSNVTGIVDRL